MKDDSFAQNRYDWLENFPEQHRSALLSHEIQSNSRKPEADKKPKRSDRYKRLYEAAETTPVETKTFQDRRASPRIDEPNKNAHLVNANRHYASNLPVDRRQSCDTRFPQEKCRRSRKHSEEISIRNFSTLRDISPVQDAIEKRKRIFAADTAIPPMQIDTLEYNVLIGDDFMFIGCIEHSIAQWRTISDRQILAMDGKRSLKFWEENKEQLLKACDLHQEKIRCINKNFS